MDLADVPVAVLAGGLATRLRSVAAGVPKALVPLAGRPFIDHQLERLRRQGARRVVLCVGHLAAQLREHVGDGSRFGLEVLFSEDGPTLLGTGGAVRRALPLLGELFWVTYGDTLLAADHAAILAEFACHPDALGLMTVLHNGDQWDRSNVVFRDGRLLRYSKGARSPDMAYIDYGLSLLRREAAEELPADRPCDLAELYTRLVERGRMVGFEVTNRFYEIGTPESLAEADEYLRRTAADPRAA